jgi:hypothetical protein
MAAETNCHKLCAAEIKACTAEIAPATRCKRAGRAKAICRKAVRALLKGCKQGVIINCETTGGC